MSKKWNSVALRPAQLYCAARTKGVAFTMKTTHHAIFQAHCTVQMIVCWTKRCEIDQQSCVPGCLHWGSFFLAYWIISRDRCGSQDDSNNCVLHWSRGAPTGTPTEIICLESLKHVKRLFCTYHFGPIDSGHLSLSLAKSNEPPFTEFSWPQDLLGPALRRTFCFLE